MHHGVHFGPPRLPELFRSMPKTVSVTLLQAAKEPTVNTVPAEGNFLQIAFGQRAAARAVGCRWRLQTLVRLFSTKQHSSPALAVVQSWHASE